MAADRSAAGHPALWIALLAAGIAATLHLIQAGPLVGYQHFPRLADLLAPDHRGAVLILAVQALLVAGGLWRCRESLKRFRPGWPAWSVAAVGALWVLSSAALSRDPVQYAGELALAGAVQALHLGTVGLFALALDGRRLAAVDRAAARLLGPASEAVVPARPDRLAWTLAAGVTLVAAALAWWSYQRHPHVPDEVAYLLQARYLAAGRLELALPPVPEAFNVDLMTYQATRWFSPVPPGWPFILAVGAFLGAPWLVNPVLGGINVLLAHLVLRELYPPRTTRIALLLLAASPWHLLMAMNLMTHTATLTAGLLAAAAVARLRRDPRIRWAVVAGVGIGIVGLIRPLEGLAVAAVLGPWSLAARGARVRLLPSAVLTATSVAVGAAVLPYNAYYTGSAGRFPIMEYTDLHYGPGSNALGFGANRGLPWPGLDPLPGHGPADVVINAALNLFQVNTELHGWAIGSILVLAGFLAWGRVRRPDLGMVAVILVVIGLHSFYYFSGGPDFGARYWYLILLPCVVLTTRGLEGAEMRAAAAVPGSGGRVLAAAAALTLAALLLFVPWRAIDKYHHYRGMRPDLRTLAADPALRDAVILVRGHRHPDYASAIVYNPLDLTERAPVFAWDRGPEVRDALVESFPGRQFWIVEGPSVTGRGFEISAGPLSGDQLRQRQDSVIPSP